MADGQPFDREEGEPGTEGLLEGPTDDDTDSLSSTGSPASWDSISNESSNSGSLPPPSVDAPTADPAMSEYMSYITTTLNQLATIALSIRKAGNKFKFEKIDAAFDDAMLQEFRSHLTTIILRAFPDDEAKGLSSEQKIQQFSDHSKLTHIQKRLVHANVLRRHRLDFITASRKTRMTPIHWDIESLEDVRSRRPEGSSVAGSRASSTSKVANLSKLGATQTYLCCPKPGSDGLLICPYCGDILAPSHAAS